MASEAPGRAGAMTFEPADNVVHNLGRSARWTTANVDEALPGVLTPLTATFYERPTEDSARAAWFSLGAMTRAERLVPPDIDGRFFSQMFGYSTANVDLFGEMAARMPGGSAAALEEQLFGSSSPEAQTGTSRARYPFVALRAPRTIIAAARALRPLAEDVEAWWARTSFALAGADLETARAAMGDAYSRFTEILNVHLVLTMACQALMERVADTATRADLPGLELELIKSAQGTAEFALVNDLRALSEERITLDRFLHSHGYHGPQEGLLEAVVWREEPALVRTLAARYRDHEHRETTDELRLRRRREQAAAVARLSDALGPVRAGPAKLLVRLAAGAPDWRETGRANILRAVDVGRAAARAAGAALVARGELADPDDIFFLTVDEVLAGAPAGARERIADRRADHERFKTLQLPHIWRGVPVPAEASAPPPTNDAADTIVGLGVSGGTGEGIVQVVHDQRDADLEEGSVLVCRTTDPSWASLFPLVEAVVTDVGSAMSHAAIVCRELGLPCVANTRGATTLLRDGDRVRVDGTKGVVEVLQRAQPTEKGKR
jgi:phosphohistidine swiveling domain-containing protein